MKGKSLVAMVLVTLIVGVQVGQIGIAEEEIKPRLLDIKDIKAYKIPYNLCNWYAKRDEKCLNLRSLIEGGLLASPLALVVESKEQKHGLGYRVWIAYDENKEKKVLEEVNRIASKYDGIVRYICDVGVAEGYTDDFVIAWFPKKVNFNDLKSEFKKISGVQKVVKGSEGFKYQIGVKKSEERSGVEKVVKEYNGKVLTYWELGDRLIVWFPEWTDRERLKEDLFETEEVQYMTYLEHIWIEVQVEFGYPQA
jgi:hypothetical protein